MPSTRNSQLGLLYIAHLLISVDGVIDENEYAALGLIKDREKIPDSIFKEFESSIKGKSEREIYITGVELLNSCSDTEKLNVFAHLHLLSDVDGRVHVKEVRLLLYTIKTTGIEFDDVVARAKVIKDN